VIELYAITEHPAPPLPTVADVALDAAGAGSLAVVWAPADAQGHVTIAGMRRYETIVEALMADRDLLPMRFGTRVADPAAAVRVLGERRDELTRALARVRGTAEVAVRVVAAPGAAADAERAVAAVQAPLARRARAASCRPGAGGDLLRGAYLVERDAVDAFAAAVGELQDTHPDLRLLCTGPWPPYSFTG
jgi:hypothetical protein